MQQIRFKVVSGCLISRLIGFIMGCIIWQFKKLSLWPFNQDSVTNLILATNLVLIVLQPTSPCTQMNQLLWVWFLWCPPGVYQTLAGFHQRCFTRIRSPFATPAALILPSPSFVICGTHRERTPSVLCLFAVDLFMELVYGLVKHIAFGLCLLQWGQRRYSEDNRQQFGCAQSVPSW